jgi:hypothetical protein
MKELKINKRKKKDHSHLNLELLEEKWEMQYYELKKFKKRYGHCDVPISLKPEYKRYRVLSRWCRTQRMRAKYINPDRVNKLNKIGFTWNILEQDFENNFRKLKQFCEKNGHCRVKESENLPLSKWCTRLRFERREGILKVERINRLTQLGFDWQRIKELRWEQQFLRLKQYKKKYGDYNVPESGQYVPLSAWVRGQRVYYRTKNKLLTPERIARLNNIGFTWVKPNERSNRIKETDLLNELKRLYKQVGRPPSNIHINKYGKYGQKAYYNHFGSIPKALEAAGMPEKAFDRKWRIQFDELKKFKEKYGHCDVPLSKAKKYYELAQWCRTQRRWTQFHFPERVKELNKIGFTWNISDKWFEDYFQQLKLYKEKHGHCNVRYIENYELAEWCRRQKRESANKTLAGERIKRLTELGFDWVIRIRKITNADLINELRRLHKLLGKTPRSSDIDRLSKYTAKPYRRRWGNIPKALEAAGISSSAFK